MKLLFSLLLIGILHPSFVPKPNSEKVYICVSKTSAVYHVTNKCRGLQKCTHTIKEVTEKEAKDDYGKKKCKVCW